RILPVRPADSATGRSTLSRSRQGQSIRKGGPDDSSKATPWATRSATPRLGSRQPSRTVRPHHVRRRPPFWILPLALAALALGSVVVFSLATRTHDSSSQ